MVLDELESAYVIIDGEIWPLRSVSFPSVVPSPHAVQTRIGSKVQFRWPAPAGICLTRKNNSWRWLESKHKLVGRFKDGRKLEVYDGWVVVTLS